MMITTTKNKRTPLLTQTPEQYVFLIACAVFEYQDVAISWLTTPNVALAGETPLERLRHNNEPDEVLTVLGRYEHGVYS